MKKKDYEEIIEIQDDKINVLVMGVSGCGKSTLINSVIGEEVADTGVGKAITKSIAVYEKESLPFRLIDTVGYEFGFLRQLKMKRELNKWGKDAIKNKKTNQLIHAIWFCVDGTVKRVSNELLDYIRSVSKNWPEVPIIVVFTKSYSTTEIEENENMMRDVLNSYKRKDELNVKGIVSVVAKSYQVTYEVTIHPMGLDSLIEKTSALIPEANQIAKKGIKNLDIKIKKNMASSVVLTSTSLATVVGAIPIPIPDATILVPLQITMLQSISKTYKIEDKKLSNEIIDTIIKVGGTTLVAKSLLNVLKGIPGIGVGVATLNAIVAGVITFVTGQVSVIIFEKVYLDEINLNTIDWDSEIGKLFKEKLPEILKLIQNYTETNKTLKIEDLTKILSILFKKQ